MAAASSADIPAVQKEIAALLPSATVSTSSSLASAAVGRRIREFGTLKALGWRSRRIVGQVLGESLVMGITGVVLGLGGAAVISAIAPALSATVGENPGSAPPQNVTFNGGGSSHSTVAGYDRTVAVHLTARSRSP